MSISRPDPSPEIQVWAPQHLPGNLSRHQAPQTQPIKTNPPPCLRLASPLFPGSVKGLGLYPVSPLRQPQAALPPQPQTQLVIHVSSCLLDISPWVSSRHLPCACQNWTPHPELLLPVCPALQMAASSFQLLRPNPWSHPWLLVLPPSHPTNRSVHGSC